MNRESLPAWVRALSSLRLTTFLLLAVFVEVLWGTVVQTRDGLWASQQVVFENWWGGIPLLCALGAVNLTAAFLVRFRWAWRNAGLLVAHLGLLALILSGGLGLAFSKSSSIDLAPGGMAAGGHVAGRWEVVQVRHDSSGGQTATVPLDGISEGELLEFGPGRGQAQVVGFTAHGNIGADQLPIPLPRGKEPGERVPAVALDWAPAQGAPPIRVGLDGNRPMAAAGPGTMFMLQSRIHPMPFRLQLVSFRREVHPGSTRPKAFESRVKVLEDGGEREAVIRMNHPLRVGRFTVYQASWRTEEKTGVERTILSVVENPTAGLPYWATLLIGLGLALHFLTRVRWHVPARAAVVAVLLGLPSVVGAAEPALPPVPPSLASLPLQFDGRIKSFETFANHSLLQFSGRSKVRGISAERWLAAVLLEPDRVRELPVFLIENPDVRDALGLEGKDRDRYSWARFEACGATLEALAERAAMKANEDRSAVERELLRLSDGWIRYAMLESSLAFLRAGSVPPLAGGEPPARRFLDLAQNSHRHAQLLDSLTSIPASARTPRDSALLGWFRLVFDRAANWDASAFPSIPLTDSVNSPWTSPAVVLRDRGMMDSSFARTARDWDDLRTSWMAADAAAAETAARSLHDSTVVRAGSALRPAGLRAEAVYNRVKPVETAMYLFLLAVFPALLGAWKGRKFWLRAADAASVVALVVLVTGMVLRMVVTLRPPVTNLYETFLFVAAVTVPSLLAGRWWRGWLAASPLAALSGFCLLLLARGFGADGDTMPVLVAVLDSNFWLTVHVLTITIGYGGVVAAGLAAHWHLAGLRAGRSDGADVVRGMMAFGLFFTFVGTLLGGVWADQSWGRFWGWDPKENGALLIVLWVAALFHARASGMIGTRGFSIGSVLAISTVVFAWFGVNLLGVGLHSYGFTEGTLWGLGAFVLFEAAFLAWFARPTPRR